MHPAVDRVAGRRRGREDEAGSPVDGGERSGRVTGRRWDRKEEVGPPVDGGREKNRPCHRSTV
eukprot:5829042-Lingulodinium_polyedra.AAC.1